MAGRSTRLASELRRSAETSDLKLRILALDVTDPASIKAAAAELDGRAIDLLLNNAGISKPRGHTIGNIDYEAWARVVDTNTMGVTSNVGFGPERWGNRPADLWIAEDLGCCASG